MALRMLPGDAAPARAVHDGHSQAGRTCREDLAVVTHHGAAGQPATRPRGPVPTISQSMATHLLLRAGRVPGGWLSVAPSTFRFSPADAAWHCRPLLWPQRGPRQHRQRGGPGSRSGLSAAPKFLQQGLPGHEALVLSRSFSSCASSSEAHPWHSGWPGKGSALH